MNPVHLVTGLFWTQRKHKGQGLGSFLHILVAIENWGIMPYQFSLVA